MRSIALMFAAAVMATPAVAADRIAVAFPDSPLHIEAPRNAAALEAALGVQKVISEQIAAVRADDAKAAFSFVTPQLRQQFVSEKAYLDVIRARFPAIPNSRIVSFGDLRETSFGTAQLVELTDAQGQPWMALFLMDKGDRDKGEASWKIANVVMVKMPATEV